MESQGFHFHTLAGEPYWDESAHYHFSSRQIDLLEAATQELHELSLQAVQYVLDKHLFTKLKIPEHAIARAL